MTIPQIEGSQLGGDVSGSDTCMVDVEVQGLTTAAATGKRKRGRPPRRQPKLQPPLPTKEDEEEDVCFICFDGGTLVLCDRRGCPKAYHPACIKRDEAFFRSKAKWTCGWHICSSCEKASHHMCYTCTYSLCRGCTKNADYFSVRGNKGFCGTCFRTIMLIENIPVGNMAVVQVDFDDKTSWEYLFKFYWVCLKTKLGLTVDDLVKARNAWKGDELPKDRYFWNGARTMAPTGLLSNELQHGSGEKGSKVVNQPELIKKENSHMVESSIVNKSAYLPHGGVTWATKELLEFVAYMKNGDVSILSQFDVRDLLLDYIKRNNLSDPHQKSQIICDSRLITLFGKARLGHFEMLKLLENHFLIKDNSTIEASVRVGVPDAVSRRVEGAECGDGQMRMESDRRRKLRKKADEGGSHINVNPNEYAAVDVHNINLLYLRRCLMENLLDDADKFHEKVVGSFVRIKISGGDQKLDAYRLVPVIGTSKVPEAYAVGTRTTDVMLEILNLDKEEVVSIDGISNQDFSEDECRRLRQSVKCGLVKRLSVGEILQKAVMLQPVKVTDWLEVEVLRLNHLCDQALEKGHKKQHREYAERLEALKSSNERQRLLLQIPKVRADPSMDPNYESEDDLGKTNEKKPGGHIRAGHSGLGRKKSKSSSVNRASTVLNDRGKRTRTHQSTGKSWVVLGGVMTNEQNNQVLHHEISSEIAPAVKPLTLPEGRDAFASDIENEKLWHYQDPSAKVQGPFAMTQLRKWSVNGLFPLDLRVWRMDEKQDDSILLTDALIGRFRTEPPPSHEVSSSSPDHEKSWECGSNLNQSTDKSWADNKNVESCCKSDQNSSSVHNNRKSELMNTIFGSDSPSWTASATVTTVENAQAHSSVQSSDLSKSTNSTTDQSQMCDKNSSPPSSSGNLCDTPSPQARKDDRDEKLIADLDNVKDRLNGTIEDHSKIVEVEEKRARKDDRDEKSIADFDNVKDNSNGTIEDHSKVVEVEEKRARKDERGEKSIADLDNVKDNSSGTTEDHSKLVEVEEKQARKDDRDEKLIADLDNVNVNLNGTIEDPSKIVEVEEKPTESEVYSSHSPGKNLEMLALNSSSRWASSSGVASENKSLNISDLLGPKAEHSNEGLNCQAGGNKLPASSDIAVQDSGPSWSTSSCLVVGGAQIPEIGAEWCGYSTAPAKPSAEDWSSNVVPASSLKSSTVAGDHAAMQTSGSGQVMETHLTIDAGGWQPIGAEGHEAEFSLADESVSDLLAEVEAMESLGGLPSPTSRMTCGGEMAHGSDNDCFTSIEDFGPLPDLAKNHALSTTDDLRIHSHLAIVNDPQTQLSHVPSHTSVREPLASQMLSQFAGTHEPLQASQVPCRNSLTNELVTSHMHCQSNQATGTVKLPKTDPFGPQSLSGQSCDPAGRATGTVRLPKTDPFGPQSLSGQSCDPAEVRGDAKRGDVSVKQWEAGTELQAPILSNFARGKSDSNSQRSPPHQANANSGSIKGITIPNRGSTAKGHPNLISDTYHGTVQHHDGRNAVASAGNPSSWGGHPRHGAEKSFAPRDHRGSNPHGRDSGYAKDRSSSWNRQPSYGVANGGHAFRPAPKGQRVCKYYESGYCRKGASCTYWHPRP